MTNKKIPLSEPCLFGNEWRYVKECLDSGWIATSGTFIRRFEEGVQAYVDSPHAVGVGSGTAALHLALLAIGIEPGEEVLVPTLTFIAPVNAVRYVQAHPVFMDVDPQTWQIDVDKVARFLKEECRLENGKCIHQKTGRRVKAVIAVHLLGLCCKIDRLVALAEEYKLHVIEDAAEGFGVRYKKGRHVGTFGDIGTLSFNGNKLMSAGSGGMILTSNSEWAEKIRYLATQAKDDPYEFIHGAVGFNYRLTNVHAAIGLAQLETIGERILKKRRIAAFYHEGLSQFADITRMPQVPDCEATYWLYTFLLKDEQNVYEKRKNILKQLHEEGIMARSLFHPIHLLQPYKGEIAYIMEYAKKIYERSICLPSSVGLKEADLQRVSEVLQKVLWKKY